MEKKKHAGGRRWRRIAMWLLLGCYLVSGAAIHFIEPVGFFQIVGVCGTFGSGTGPYLPHFVGKALDVITGPIQLVLIGVWIGYDWIDNNTGGYKQNRVFQDAIKDVDRVVVRDGGFGCCCDIDKAKVYCVITNSEEVAAVKRMFRFCGKDEGCKCCGEYGIDWWRGDERIAVTAIHHGETFQWVGFDGHYARFRSDAAKECCRWIAKIRNLDLRPE